MALTHIELLAVRNIQTASLEPSPCLNFLVGPNASGKSSLLEAIYLLGRAKSFRTHQARQAINFTQTQLVVTGCTLSTGGLNHHLGVSLDANGSQIRIDHTPRQKADLAYALPVQMIHPKSYRLLDGSPQLRREFLDWGVFNQQTQFLRHWRRFSKALQQRNALLKSKQSASIQAWDREIVDTALPISAFRQSYLELLSPVFNRLAALFLQLGELKVHYQPGWPDKHALASLLAQHVERDLRYGFTHYGPHRADIVITVAGRAAKDYLSRGQQKLLVLALLLAQVDLLQTSETNACCILIDDFCAELDAVNRLKLLKYLSDLRCQAFLTGTELSDFGDLSFLTDYKLFHVEHGIVHAA